MKWFAFVALRSSERACGLGISRKTFIHSALALVACRLLRPRTAHAQIDQSFIIAEPQRIYSMSPNMRSTLEAYEFDPGDVANIASAVSDLTFGFEGSRQHVMQLLSEPVSFLVGDKIVELSSEKALKKLEEILSSKRMPVQLDDERYFIIRT